jgi:hypothetical protein
MRVDVFGHGWNPSARKGLRYVNLRLPYDSSHADRLAEKSTGPFSRPTTQDTRRNRLRLAKQPGSSAPPFGRSAFARGQRTFTGDEPGASHLCGLSSSRSRWPPEDFRSIVRCPAPLVLPAEQALHTFWAKGRAPISCRLMFQRPEVVTREEVGVIGPDPASALACPVHVKRESPLTTSLEYRILRTRIRETNRLFETLRVSPSSRSTQPNQLFISVFRAGSTASAVDSKDTTPRVVQSDHPPSPHDLFPQFRAIQEEGSL